MKNFISFAKTIIYCLKMSFEASKFYTIMRLIGKIIVPILSVISALMLKSVLNELCVSDGSSSGVKRTIFLIIGISFLSIISLSVKKLVSFCEAMHNDLLEKNINLNLMKYAMKADISTFDDSDFYDKFQSVQIDSYALTGVLWNVLDLMSAMITFFGVSVILCSFNLFYCALLVVSAVPSAVFGQKHTQVLYHLGLSQMKSQRKLHYLYNVASTKQYSQDIRLFGISDLLEARYKTIWNRMFSDRLKKVKSKTISALIFDLLPECVVLFATIDIAIKIFNQEMTLGDFTFFTNLFAQFLSAMTILVYAAMGVYENKLKVNNIKTLSTPENDVEDNGTLMLKEVYDIEFKNVCFTYPLSEKPVLNNISFKINRGEKIAFVGVNGSGKTTLIKLLLRFYNASSGEIKINGIRISEFKLSSLRKCFSCYFQKMLNYSFSVAENISLSDIEKEYSQKDVLNAMKFSGAMDCFEKRADFLKLNITKMFDENGIELSGGENQKLALARTFYKNCSCIILDEPSSDLDPESEQNLFDKIKSFSDDKIIFVTSHRLSDLSLMDKIIVLENGEIIECGAPHELIKQKGRFFKLFQYQMKGSITKENMQDERCNN